MKKNYNQPELQVVELAPMTVLCASITEGPGAGGGTIPPIGD
ncbi:MAG: hypothetical protein U0K81_05965 [Paludibacteraceae bacterium]|nr:hypothetical protein [Paludibacteraceae bacterium]